MPYPMSSAPPLLGGDMFLMAIWEAMGTLLLHPCPQRILPREGRSSSYRTGSGQLAAVEALTPQRGPVHRLRTNTSRSARLRSHSRPTPRPQWTSAVASSLTSLRCELLLLRAAFAAAPPSASAVLSTSVAPPAGSNPSGVPLPYGRVTRAHAPIHAKCPAQAGRTRSDGNGVRVHTSPNSTNPSMSMTSQTTT